MNIASLSSRVIALLWGDMMLHAQTQSTFQITNSSFENYGFVTWNTVDTSVRYVHLEIHELNWQSGDTPTSVAERFEIWDKCYAKVPNAYLAAPPAYKQYKMVLKGYDHAHNPLPDVAAISSPPATKGCFWDCESSN